MDVAYDNIQREAYPDDDQRKEGKDDKSEGSAQANTLNADIQDAYKAISNSPWAAKLGGFWGNVRKQGEQYYETAKKEYSPVTEQASQGISSIISRARGLSIQQPITAASSSSASGKEKVVDPEAHPDRPDSLPADIVKEATGIFTRFRSAAQERLKDVQKAEDVADEALLKFGSNIRNFLRDAVTIAPPEEGQDASKVLFESKDAEGRRVIHTTRFDAQLHVIHSSLDSFMKDPVSPEWKPWSDKFDIQTHTDVISKDVEKYDELKRAMEKVVPEKVEYADFWRRYYFLRHVIESEEKRRKELLQASATNATDEEVAWDEDSEEEEEVAKKADVPKKEVKKVEVKKQEEDDEDEEDSEESEEEDEEESDEEEEDDEEEEEEDDSEEEEDDSEDETSTPNAAHPLAASKDTLKPGTQAKAQPKPQGARKTGDQHSQADSDASYDVVSGASSRAQSSPKEAKKDAVAEESDEDDWE